LTLHEVPGPPAQIGEFRVGSALVCHPGPTVGYRIESRGAAIAYIPDHEPALGAHGFPGAPEWTSGWELAAGVDLLIHDGQYTAAEYPNHLGWGHCAVDDALRFAALAKVKRLILFHHDPGRNDAGIDALLRQTATTNHGFDVTAAAEGASVEIS
jgi:phosphoribosyl 1,2-cyclic phosphodiesterase